MLKTRIILFISAVVITVLLFNLPRIVVENKENTLEAGNSREALPAQKSEEITKAHDRQLTDEQTSTVNHLRQSYLNAESKEKSIIFADSLAAVFNSINFYDSSAYYLEKITEIDESESAYIDAADAYLKAFNFAVEENKRSSLASKARNNYEKALAINPDNPDAKANMALTFVTTSSPMKGIMMLREVLNEDPENQTALFNMGLLSIISGQIDKAVERFSSILKINDNHYEAMLYLGYCYLQEGENEKAKPLLEKVLASDAEDQLKETAEGYLESIK